MSERPPRSSSKDDREPRGPHATRICDKCGSRFSGEARFCPFDAEPLVVALESRRPRDPLVGTVIDGRYEVQSMMGEGGMGTVYRVTHRVLGKALALKVLRADLSRESELALRFLREARAAASISHPNVVQITDFGTLPSGQPYFVMELLGGASLSATLRKGGPLPAARAVRALRQMIEALQAAHDAGVVHRDLKPDNIVLCPAANGTEVVKVLDFGLAKVAGQSRLTKAGVVFGTPHYMSPEQASGRPVDARTDVYALGVVMYEMFTGKVPFEADTYMGVLTKHLYVAPTPPSVVLHERGDRGGAAHGLGALEQLTLRCLEKKPERRFGSMRALGTALDKVAQFTADGGLVVRPAELGEPGEPHLADDLELPTDVELRLAASRDRREGKERPRVGAWMVAALAFLGIFAVSLVSLLSHRSGEPEATGSEPEPAVPAVPEPPAPIRVEPAPAKAAPPPGATEPGESTTTLHGASVEPPAAALPPALPAGGSAKIPVTRVPHGAAESPAKPAEGPRREPATVPTPAAKSPTKQRKIGGGEIVDPWGG